MFVLVENLKINYLKDDGQRKKTIVFFHGWQDNLRRWDKIVELLRNDFEIIRLDFPGFGMSDLPEKPWNITDYAVFLNDFFKKMEINNAVVVGHSFGGRVVIKFSSLYPEKISKLVLVDSAGIKPRKTFKSIVYFILAKIGSIIFISPFLSRLKEKLRDKFYKTIAAEDYFNLTNPIIKKSFLKIIGEDLRNDALKIKNPALIIWGEKDYETPLADAFIFNKTIKNSKLIVMENADHLPFIGREEEFAKIIKDFVLEDAD